MAFRSLTFGLSLAVLTAMLALAHERANFEFRSAEIAVFASIDPFARGYAILNGTSDGFEVEEAAIVTTSLPYNLTVKGGPLVSIRRPVVGRLRSPLRHSRFPKHRHAHLSRSCAFERPWRSSCRRRGR